jgi:hypothetical protein
MQRWSKPIRNAEVRGSIPLCSTNRIKHLRQGSRPCRFAFGVDLTWTPASQALDAFFRALHASNASHANVCVAENFSDRHKFLTTIRKSCSATVTEISQLKIVTFFFTGGWSSRYLPRPFGSAERLIRYCWVSGWFLMCGGGETTMIVRHLSLPYLSLLCHSHEYFECEA